MKSKKKSIKHKYGHIRYRKGKQGMSVNYLYKDTSETFPPGTPQNVIQERINRIEAEIDALRYGLIDRLTFKDKSQQTCTVLELTEAYLNSNKFHFLKPKTQTRYQYTVDVFFRWAKPDTQVRDLDVGNFILWLYEKRLAKHKDKSKDIQEAIKRGVNKEISDLKVIFGFGVLNGLLKEAPKISKLKTDKIRDYYILTEPQIILLENALEGYFKLAFQIFRYTLARKCEILRDYLDPDGLRWRNIDWMRNQMTLHSKGQKSTIPLHSILRRQLLEQRLFTKPQDFVIPYSADTIGKHFKIKMKELGIYKFGNNIHLIRRSCATILLNRSSDIKAVKEILRHSDIKTTEIYAFLSEEKKREVINLL